MKSIDIIALERNHGSFNYAPMPVVFSRGKGAYLWDVEGKRYLDFVSGFSAVSQGHCHPRIVRAIQEQAATLTLLSRALHSDQFGPFAAYCTEMFGYERVLMMNTGAEAFDTAVKLARKWGHKRKGIAAGTVKIVVCSGNFHGRTMAAVSASGNEDHHCVFGPVLDGFVRIPFGDSSALALALADPTVAAFIVEPIQAEAGIVVPADGYLAQAARLCFEANVLFIADEIQTGLGRTGKRLACDHEGVRPDIVLLGKALSGGTIPVSAVLADSSVLELLQPGDHGSTFGGNPLACHVAMAALRVIEEEGLAARAEEMGALFRSAVRDLGSPLVKEVRGKGLLNAVVFDFGGGGAEADQEFSLSLKAAGLIAKATRTNVFRFAPPLVVEREDILEAVRCIDHCARLMVGGANEALDNTMKNLQKRSATEIAG